MELACSFDIKECVDVATAKFAAYKDSGKEPKAEFKRTILNTVMMKDVDADVLANWDFLWDKYQKSDDASEQQTLYYALGLIQDEAKLKE